MTIPPVVDVLTGRELKPGDVYGAIRPDRQPNELGSTDRHVFMGIRPATAADLAPWHGSLRADFMVDLQEMHDDGSFGRRAWWPVIPSHHYRWFLPGWFFERVIAL